MTLNDQTNRINQKKIKKKKKRSKAKTLSQPINRERINSKIIGADWQKIRKWIKGKRKKRSTRRVLMVKKQMCECSVGGKKAGQWYRNEDRPTDVWTDVCLDQMDR